jgi:hypothetical protein
MGDAPWYGQRCGRVKAQCQSRLTEPTRSVFLAFGRALLSLFVFVFRVKRKEMSTLGRESP